MKNNIIVLLGKLRTSFRQSADNQIDLISMLSRVEDQDASISEVTVNSGKGIPYKISTVLSEGIKSVQVKVADMNTGDFTHTSLIPIDADDGLDLDFEVDGLGMSAGDMVQDVQKTEHFNSLVSEISNMFMTRPNVSISTLDAYISHNMSTTDETISQFRSLILMNAPSGEINQYTFLKLVQSIMNQGKQDLEDGKLTLNTSSPMFVANAIGTIILTVLQTVAQVVSTVLMAVAGVIGIIVSVLANLVSTIISNLSNVIRTDIGFKADEQLNIFDAPIVACSDDFDYSAMGTNYPMHIKDVDTNIADVVSAGGITFYIWSGGSDEDKHGWNVNGFLAMDLHPTRTLEWLAFTTGSSVSGTYGPSAALNLTLDPDSQKFPESVYFTTDELASLGCSGGDNLMLAAMFNYAMICWRDVRFSNQAMTFSLQNSWHTINTGQLDNWGYKTQGFILALQLIAAATAGYNLTTLVGDYGSGVGSALTDLAIAMFQQESTFRNRRTTSDMPHDFYNRTFTITGIGDISLTIYKSALHGLLGMPTISTLTYEKGTEYVVDVQTNAIPTSGMFSFVNTKWEHVVAALVIATAVSAAVCIATTVGKVKYKQWAQKKSLQQWGKLQEARSHYIDADTGAIIGDEADYKRFRKQIKKYNKWGRLLGYGSYDVTNNWNNAPEMPTLSEVPTSSFETDSLISDLTDDGELNLSALKTSITGDDALSLRDIRRLLTGQ